MNLPCLTLVLPGDTSDSLVVKGQENFYVNLINFK